MSSQMFDNYESNITPQNTMATYITEFFEMSHK